MSKNSDEDQEYLDKHYPFIEQGADPPGRWVERPLKPGLQEMRLWDGKDGWRTRHGQATVVWSTGKPVKVFSALYPDGTRGLVRNGFEHGFQRCSTGPKLWIDGNIDIRPDDVIFIDGPQLTYVAPPQTDKPNLEADMASDPSFLAALQDDRFARAVYAVFANREFLRIADEQSWVCGMRQAGGLVAKLRGRGESYIDYFGDIDFEGIWPADRADREARTRREIERALQRHAEGRSTQAQLSQQIARLEREIAGLRRNENADVFEALRAHLERLGWRTARFSDYDKWEQGKTTRNIEVLRTIKHLEKRDLGATPGWAVPLKAQLKNKESMPWAMVEVSEFEKMASEEREVILPGAVWYRLLDLAVSGRISEDEFERLKARLRGTSPST
jgi:hypothetical protein